MRRHESKRGVFQGGSTVAASGRGGKGTSSPEVKGDLGELFQRSVGQKLQCGDSERK